MNPGRPVKPGLLPIEPDTAPGVCGVIRGMGIKKGQWPYIFPWQGSLSGYRFVVAI